VQEIDLVRLLAVVEDTAVEVRLLNRMQTGASIMRVVSSIKLLSMIQLSKILPS
jgi:hypothetical protein